MPIISNTIVANTISIVTKSHQTIHKVTDSADSNITTHIPNLHWKFRIVGILFHFHKSIALLHTYINVHVAKAIFVCCR
jgi:hypothetical protein